MKVVAAKGFGSAEHSIPIDPNKEPEANIKDTGPWFGQRHVVVVMGFLIVCCSAMGRQVFSVSMVAMVNYTAIELINHHRQQIMAGNKTFHSGPPEELCHFSENKEVEVLKDGEFVWDAQTQGILAGASYWGTVASMVPSSIVTQKYGGKTVALVSTLLIGLSALLTPLAAKTGVIYLLIIRAIGGFVMGSVIVGTSTLLTRWAPINERGRMNSYMGSGGPCGIVLATSLTGLIADSPFLGGWPTAFYSLGCLCVITSILWALFVFEGPNKNPWISMEERKYIESGTGVINNKQPTPWGTILTSTPVWSLLIASAGFSWISLSMNSLIPTYMRTILHFNITQNGLLSSLPYLGRVLVSNISSHIGDVCLEKGIRRNTVRKTLLTLCMLIPGILLIIAVHVPCSRTLNVSLFVAATSIAGCAFPSLFINHTDLAPNFTGPILSLAAVFGNMSGIVSQYTAGYILSDLGDIIKWRTVIFIGCGLNIGTLVVFLLFGTAEQQSWNSNPKQEEKKEKQAKTVF